MGGCASRPKESDMNNEEDSVPNKHVSENIVVKENTIENIENQNQTETRTTETSDEVKETTPTIEPEVAVIEETSSGGAAAAPEKVENMVAATKNIEAGPKRVEVVGEVVEAEPVKTEVVMELVKKDKEAIVTV